MLRPVSDGDLAIAPGTVVAGQYRIETPLGEGGYGAVYAATQLNLGRRVALKVLHPDVISRGTALQRFRREAQLAQGLSHPNTVRLFDFGEAYGRPYIAYELLDGRSLENVLERETRLAPMRVLRIAAQTLKALMEAHEKGIVHRDIKPANLFICNFAGEPDFVKVLDFGIASATVPTEKGALTQEGTTLGTPAYMSPEQALAMPLDGRADVYSVGLVMCESLTGQRVYSGTTAMEILMAQASERPAPLPREIVESAFGPLLLRATTKNRDQRFASAREMLDAVETAMRSTPPDVAMGSSVGVLPSGLVGSGAAGWSSAPAGAPRVGFATAPTAYAQLTPAGGMALWNPSAPTPTVAATVAPGSTLSASSLALPANGAVQVPIVGVPGAPGFAPVALARSSSGGSKMPWIAAGIGVVLLAAAGFGVWALVQYEAALDRARSRHVHATKAAPDDTGDSDDSDEPTRPPIKLAHGTAPTSLPNFKVRGKSAQQILDRMPELGWRLLNQNESDIGFGAQATYTYEDKNGANAVLKFSKVGVPSLGLAPGEKQVSDGGFTVDLTVVSDEGDFFEAPMDTLLAGG